ncbi:MAG: Uma2 family endonuclease [Thermodesulfobacteriota bacterium]
MDEPRTQPSRAPGPMTLEEWAELPDEVEGELVDGFLVEEEVPELIHEAIVGWLIHELGGWAYARRRRDRVEKLAEYAAFGIPWYWIVDWQPRTLEIFARGPDGRYALALEASGGTQRDVPGCAGLVLDLDDLWVRVDRFR